MSKESIDEGRRTFLKSLLVVSTAAVAAGMLRGLGVLVPPEVGISSFPKLLLVSSTGEPIKSSDIPVNGQKMAFFPYPLNNEPTMILNLGDSTNTPVKVSPTTVKVPQTGTTYQAPGGVGPYGSIVAFSGICQHLGCQFPELTFYPPGVKAITVNGPIDKVIHCDCHGSTYDPYAGGAVVTGPTVRPLPSAVLEWDPSTDELYVVKMIGPVIYGHPGYESPTEDTVENPTGDLEGGSPLTGTTTQVSFYDNPAISG